MARKRNPKNPKDPATTVLYDHKDKELLLRPDVGLQAQFKQRRPPATYRYDPSLDPELSWDINADREHGEALIRRIQEAQTLEEARAAAAELSRMSQPFLNWAGKAERREFTVPTLPLFVHERLSTKAILESVHSHKRDKQQALSLFADEELDISDRILRAYEHKSPWVNRMILGDSLVVMNSLLRYEGLGGQVQMIYMDPPYGVKFGSNFQPFIRRRDVKHGDDEDLTREPEMVQAYRDTWELGLHSYLTCLRDRFRLSWELLHPTGSIFVQIGDENVHHVREVMSEVFGSSNFMGLIVFVKTTGKGGKYLDVTTDYLLWFARDAERVKYHQLFAERSRYAFEKMFTMVELPDGTCRRLTREERESGALPAGGKLLTPQGLFNDSGGETSRFPYEFNGQTFVPAPGYFWRTNRQGLDTLKAAGRLIALGKTLRWKQYEVDFPLTQVGALWTDTMPSGYARESSIYVVQTSTKPVARCLLMTTDPGDLVLDPTCGSGTTAYAAEEWGRRWITIDCSRVPLALARQRLLTATFPYYELRDESAGVAGGFKYERRRNNKGEEVGGIVPHITLRSITRGEKAEEAVLVDRPNVVSAVVRVSGPLVVEATIPTPSNGGEAETAEAAATPEADDHIGRMIEVLKRSPILRLIGNQTVEFRKVRRPARALDLHAEAETGPEDAPRQVAFIFGPENGAVTEAMAFAAAREAYAKSYAQLFVVGFAAQDAATKLIRNCEQAVGMPATYVNATMDIQMHDLLKTTRASHIFSVTGAPEVRLVRLKKPKGNGPLYQVDLLGLDVFDPVTMDVDHRSGDDVPAWLLDTDYNELAFRVCQAFFPRTAAWDSLKRALRGTYEDSVWDHLAGTVSEPFSEGEHRRIAVKVIDDRGNELMVVKSLDEAEDG